MLKQNKVSIIWKGLSCDNQVSAQPLNLSDGG